MSGFSTNYIMTIAFTKTAPTSSGYTQVSVGATTSAGTTAYASGTAGVSDVIAYVKANSSDNTKYDIIFYCPGTIYAPEGSVRLFHNRNLSNTFTSLNSISFENFDTSKVTDMSVMFSSCSSLTSLDVSGFNTSNVTGMSLMFYACSKLTSLNLSSFNMLNVASTGSMLSGCSALTEIQTPKAIGSKTVKLPTETGYSWVDKTITSTTYTTISSSNINKTLILKAN